jgi:hypothetical protein
MRRLDPASAKVLTTFTLSSFVDPWAGAFAFAAWGGVFYVFYGYPGPTTTVYRLGLDGKLTTHLLDSGLVIVGAGVSTCAPSS